MSQKGNLDGKVALVTGSARGIGYSIACGLAEAGANVAVADLNREGARQSAEIISQNYQPAIGVGVNTADSQQVQNMMEEVAGTFGKIDILVNNAGIVVRKPAVETTEVEWDEILDINLKGPFLCSKAVYPHFCAQGGGKIVNIVSAQVGVVEPNRAAYIASKTGLLGLTRAMAVELAKDNIRVNAVGPGWTKTEINRQALDGDDNLLQYIHSKMPLARMADPHEIAGLVVYLVSDQADYITGQVIYIDGGWTVW